MTLRIATRFTGFAFAMAFSLAACGEVAAPMPRASDGELDLRQIQSAQVAALEGEWLLHRPALLPPAQLPAEIMRPYPVPSEWSDYKDAPDAAPAGPDGSGTYYLRVLLPEAAVGTEWALRVPRVDTAYRMYLNGEAALATGVPAPGASGHSPRYRTFTHFFRLEQSELSIVLHISNFDESAAGLRRSLRLGPAEAVMLEKKLVEYIDVFLIASIAVMGLYHLGLHFNRREDLPSLWFGVFCLLIAVRIAGTDELIYDRDPAPDLCGSHWPLLRVRGPCDSGNPFDPGPRRPA